MTRTTAHYANASEVEIFQQFLGGDDQAFVQLFERYDRRLRLYCIKIVGDQQVSEDLVQELWERVIRMRREPVQINEPGKYFMTMARNLCLKYVQRTRRHTSLDDLLESEHPAAEHHEQSHLEELVAMYVPKLPIDQREVLVLHHYMGYPYEEIATMRGETLGSVKMRAMRARTKLGRMISAVIDISNGEEERPPSGDILGENDR